jgi:HEAT repeat protein
MRNFITAKLFARTFIFGLVALSTTAAQDRQKTSLEAAQDEAIERAKGNADVAARQLTSPDPLVRQRAAEELARLAATDKRKLVEGYRLQEKNDRVRLALDWALYRTGKPEALFSVVRALDSNRYNQAQAYLSEIDTPDALYPFLNRVNAVTQARILEALARVGDANTLEKIKPYASSGDPRVASAARFAAREITRRLAAPQPDPQTKSL